MAERTVIGAEFLVYHSCLEYPRIILLRYNDRRVGLAVLEQNVVFGLVFLYQIVFKKQSVFLRVHHRVCDVPYLAHEHLRLVSVHLLMEV